MTRVLLACLVLVWATFATAQTETDDRDFITGLIEDAISNENFTVRLINFQGALSAEATADAITLADADGVYLRLDGLTIAWDRSALVTGRVVVDTLTAERIELIRLPVGGETDTTPQAAATPFALPDLPVSVNIRAVSAADIVLTEDLLGEPLRARFEGALSLDDGTGSADILLERTDAKTGVFDVSAGYNGASGQIAISLLAQEGEGGIAARLLNLPDSPALRLSVQGDAPLDDFEATIALATDGVDRVGGTVRLSRTPATDGAPADRPFAVDLRGDLRPLLEAQYHPFFGASTLLRVTGTALGDGGIDLSDLTIGADRLVLRGSAGFDAQGWPRAIDLRGRLGAGDGSRVLLPIAGAPVSVSGMALSVQYDAANSDAWQGDFDVTALARDGVSIDTIALSGGGTITPGAGAAQGRFTADLTYGARGLTLTDTALSQAIGRDIDGTLAFGRAEGEPFVVNDLTLSGAGVTAVARARVNGPDARFSTTGVMRLNATDFSRFAALTGLDLAGAGTVNLSGTVQPFDGIFDLDLAAATTDLAFGIDQLDPLLAGESTVALHAARDTTGTRIERFNLTSNGVTARAEGDVTPTGAAGNITATLRDLGQIVEGLSGPATLRADLSTDAAGVATLDTTLDAPAATGAFQGTARAAQQGYLLQGTGTATVSELNTYAPLVGRPVGGAVTLELNGSFETATQVLAAAVVAQTRDLRAGTPVLNTLLAGAGQITADVGLNEAGRLRLDALDVDFPNITAEGAISTSGTDTVASLTARLRDISLFVSDFSGPVAGDILARQDADGWRVGGEARGPVGTTARASGRVSNAGQLDLDVTGSAPLALANVYITPRQISGLARFSLSVDGPAALSSLRGPVRIEGARLTVPTLREAVENINGTITLGGGTARLDLAGESAAGGGITLTGPLDLTAPFRAALRAGINEVVLRDPLLYATTARGAVTLDGPLTGGARIGGTIDLGTVEVQVPSTGVSALGTLPAVTHLGVPTDVRATLQRAGIDTTPQPQRDRSGGADFPIDLLIRAPSRIFVRGRGLDAELGGQLRLTGSTRDIQPIGRFDLVRGRLNILGQRFELSEGFAQLQGDFTPFLRLVATTQARTGTAISIIVEGPADEIDVRFESTPQLPQDEVLAQLLFGRDLSSISPLQAVQLASAVATLAGGSQGGVINNLREGLNLDDLDFTTDEDGNAAVRAGRYLSDNVYTDVTIGASGTTEINLNIDIDRNFTARGTVASDGETSVGLFFERDY